MLVTTSAALYCSTQRCVRHANTRTHNVAQWQPIGKLLTKFAVQVENITFLKTEARLLDGVLVSVPNALLAKVRYRACYPV
eukprot:SAG31_NODE_1621_length_7724_cov_3.297049_8_plen_81_part_00